MNIPCPNVINCPGTDNPFANLSSEDPDLLTYRKTAFYVDTPPIGVTYTALACSRTFLSTISQADADNQAAIAAALCVHDTWVEPTGTPVITYFNSVQSCSVNCPDGNPFTYTVAAGQFVGLTQAEANQAAHTEACKQANAHRICLSSIASVICYDSPTTLTINATVTIPPGATVLWELVSGSVPDGMTFNGGNLSTAYCTISGTPDNPGVYNFSVRCTAQNGDHMTKAYSVTVAGLTNSLPLPDAAVNVPYGPGGLGIQLTSVGYNAPVYTIASGALPDGMQMVNGNINGTPTVAATFNFTIQISETP